MPKQLPVVLRQIVIVGAVTVVVLGFSETTFAQSERLCWINAKTGKPVPNTQLLPEEAKFDDPEHNHSSISGPLSGTFANFVRGSDGSWINSATGTPVPNSQLLPEGAKFDDPEHNHSSISGPLSGTFSNFVRVPCPPSTQSTSTSWTGGYIGGELVKNSGRVKATETLAATGVLTNQFTDSGDPLGLGLVAGYNFAPWGNNVVLGPFLSADWLRQTINRNFAGGQFLGTTTNWIFTAGAKAGVVATPGLLVYGLAGAAFLNHDLNVNFATSASSNATTSGFTLGLGLEYQPQSWTLGGNPVSVFAQYQHTWWSAANFRTPASSPLFNYTFRREDDTLRFGVLVHFAAH